MHPDPFPTEQDQLNALAAPFPPECHKTRQEAGKTFTYLEHSTVAERLRDVFGSSVSIRTGQVLHASEISLDDHLLGYVDMEVIIEATFVSGRTVVVSGWGEADVLATKPKSEQDIKDGKKRGRANQPFKSAFSDGLKVAATRLGVGAYLYSEEGRAEVTREQKRVEEDARTKQVLTCQECQGEILPGAIDGVRYETALEFMNATRKKYRRRWCNTCIAKHQNLATTTTC